MVVPDTVIRKLSASEAIFFYNETFAFTAPWKQDKVY